MKLIGQWIVLFLITHLASAGVLSPNHPDKGLVSRDTNHFIDENINYKLFDGRVTDKDDKGRILKIKVENNNSKFFRAGDVVYFKINRRYAVNQCKAFVRQVEPFYFTILVQDFSNCWDENNYFRRGTVLNFESEDLARRVEEASKYRSLLLVRKDDFLKQLNGINNFVWGFDQHKVKKAAKYDKRINEMQIEKRKALDNLILKKQENLVLQNELMRKLDSIDESLHYYKIERQELLLDRWDHAHNRALPVGRRPQILKKP
jgi:hypothetical protein